MPEELTSSPPSRRRRVFRVCRKGFLWFLLAFVSALVYLNQVGLPGFLKNPILERLRERGVQADFTRLRWRWQEGLVAENLVLHSTNAVIGPEFRSADARLKLGVSGWWHPRLRLTSLQVQGAQFSWLLPAASGVPPLKIDAIDAELALDPDGRLELRHFTSRFKGLKLEVSGQLAHPESLPRSPGTNALPARIALLNRTMTQVAGYLTNFQFAAAPALQLMFQADAGQWNTLQADLELHLPETRTTWGNADDFRLHARIRPASATNAEPGCVIQLAARAVDTPWGRLDDWRASCLTVPVLQPPLHSSNRISFTFSRLETRWGSVEGGDANCVVEALDPAHPDDLDLTLDLNGRRLVTARGATGPLSLHSSGTFDRRNARPIHGIHELTFHELVASNFSAALVHARVLQRALPTNPPAADETWGFWRVLQPYDLGFEIEAEKIAAHGAAVDSLNLTGSWSAPRLEISNLHGSMYGGTAGAQVSVDVPSRVIRAAAEVGFDFHGLDPVFSSRFRNWFAPYQWTGRPRATVSGKIRWPDWRNLNPNWREEVAPTIGISGQFHVDHAFYKGIPGDEAFSDFHFTNFVWNLPNLTVVRPEGTTVASYEGDERTKDYVWKIAGDIDPQALKPLFSGKQLKVFDSFTNYATPHVEGTIWGRWRDHERIGFRANVSAPKVLVRGEYADFARASVEYTNEFLTIRNVEIQQSNRLGHAEAMGIDLPNNLMYFTNVDSGLPPQSIARAIGPVTAHAIEPYVFDGAPRIRVNGILGLKDHDSTDLQFDVNGGPFHWWRFNLDQIEGNLWWRSNRLDLTNMLASFYNGRTAGAGTFLFFTNSRPTEFSFALTATNAQLRPLVHDVFFKTNGLEGALSGTLNVTSARADSLDTWQGSGNLHLRDGVVWDIPIFGIFSPIFNAISPGLGRSRADEALATFTIVNGTVISRDLQVRSPEFSMLYQGSVDFLGNVDARMQARILKDSGVLGPLISTALWPLTKIFEYRLSGTLAQPVAEPVHIPRFLLMALEPFKALQGVLKGVGDVVTPKDTAPAETPLPKP